MRAIHWLLLDNLSNGWHYSTNMNKLFADKAMQWAEENGYVKNGLITDEGRGYFILHHVDRVKD